MKPGTPWAAAWRVEGWEGGACFCCGWAAAVCPCCCCRCSWSSSLSSGSGTALRCCAAAAAALPAAAQPATEGDAGEVGDAMRWPEGWAGEAAGEGEAGGVPRRGDSSTLRSVSFGSCCCAATASWSSCRWSMVASKVPSYPANDSDPVVASAAVGALLLAPALPLPLRAPRVLLAPRPGVGSLPAPWPATPLTTRPLRVDTMTPCALAISGANAERNGTWQAGRWSTPSWLTNKFQNGNDRWAPNWLSTGMPRMYNWQIHPTSWRNTSVQPACNHLALLSNLLTGGVQEPWYTV